MKRLILLLISVGLLCVLPLATPLCGVGAGHVMGYYPGIMDTLKDCRLSSEVLGDDISVAPIGMSCGTAETRGAFGIVTWRLPVKGTQADGTYSFYLEKRGGDWTLFQAGLEVGDRFVDIKNCRFAKPTGPSGKIQIAPDGQQPMGPNMRRRRY